MGEPSKTSPKGIVPSFKFNDDQKVAYAYATEAKFKYLLFYGPSRSGKSFLILYLIFLRALRAPNSRHFVGRGARNACEDSLFKLTLIQVFDKCFPGLRDQCDLKLSDMTVVFPNGSMIKFDGLDADRIDKVLGQEYNTVWINECNDDEVDYGTVSQLMTRLSMATPTADGKMLVNKMFFDCNPKFFSDWEYKAFKLHINPDDGDAMPDPEEWVSCKLNTTANEENLSSDYIKSLSRASAVKRQRFMVGEWCDENKSALFFDRLFVDHRIPRPETMNTPALVLAMLAEQGIELNRITVCSDPATKGNVKNDLHGITVQGKAGYGKDAHAYVLADYSCHGSPIEVCDIIAQAYKEWGASRVVMEDNAGGRWLESTMIQHSPHITPKFVNANTKTGDKTARAEPVAGMYEQGKVHHVGTFKDLEAQMCDWGSPASRKKSPDRMDAVVWGIIELLDLHQEEKPQPTGGGAYRYKRLR